MTSLGENYAHDPTRPGMLPWSGMGPREKWAAAALAMSVGYPLETSSMWWDRAQGLVMVERASPHDPTRRQLATSRLARDATEEDSRRAVLSSFGLRGLRDARDLVEGRRASRRALVGIGLLLLAAGGVLLAALVRA